MNPDEFKDREGNMKGKFFSPVNIGLIVVLLIVSSLGQGDVAAGIGAVIVVYSGQTGHRFRFKPDTDRSEATLAAHYTSLWPE